MFTVLYTRTWRAFPVRDGVKRVHHGAEKAPSTDWGAGPGVLDSEVGRRFGDGGLAHGGDAVDLGEREPGIRDRLRRGFRGQLEPGDTGLAPDAGDPDSGDDRSLLHDVAHAANHTVSA